ncbi:hypothetical protein GCM10027280_18520 [Micromonospora polyrhachis]|uniref:Uncharacterized protein n=1 Tax=Micromonospora polyrhachis TaxID=1282883 RepID=A0A7W7SLF3_9ACTN|nr:hypothetical protein [Micromonospora polyrhachis]MBB4956947.1 hypothetical protein [Micromonospora polyrhachis]
MPDEMVTANAERIRLLGIKYQTWSEEFDELVLQAEAAEIRPGHVEPGAELLKKRYGARVGTDLVKLLGDVQKSFYDIGLELIRVSKVYATTEDLSHEDVDRLNRMIKAISKTYPDYSPLTADPPTPPAL